MATNTPWTLAAKKKLALLMAELVTLVNTEFSEFFKNASVVVKSHVTQDAESAFYELRVALPVAGNCFCEIIATPSSTQKDVIHICVSLEDGTLNLLSTLCLLFKKWETLVKPHLYTGNTENEFSYVVSQLGAWAAFHQNHMKGLIDKQLIKPDYVQARHSFVLTTDLHKAPLAVEKLEQFEREEMVITQGYSVQYVLFNQAIASICAQDSLLIDFDGKAELGRVLHVEVINQGDVREYIMPTLTGTQLSVIVWNGLVQVNKFFEDNYNP